MSTLRPADREPGESAGGIGGGSGPVRDRLEAGERAVDERFDRLVRSSRRPLPGAAAAATGGVPEPLPGASVGALLRERAGLVDEALRTLWAEAFPDPDTPLALVAVGGYGRGALHPASDVDVLVLLEDAAAVPEGPLTAFVTRLWDLGRTIGHSVRTVRECCDAAAADLTIMTSLMESRTLTGDPALLDETLRRIDAAGTWDSVTFYRAKLDEQAARHRRYDDVEYNLEPNVKASPGGLRDLHNIGWVTLRRYGTSDPQALAAAGILSNREARELAEGLEFLSRVRYALHCLAGREEDRLLFDYQREIADWFGYQDAGERLAVETFMHDYFRNVLAITEVNDIVLQHIDESLQDPETIETEAIDADFRRVGDCIEAIDDGLFWQKPSALLRLFVVLAHRPEIRRVGARTIRLVRDGVSLIDDAFRTDPGNAALFLEVLRAPNKLVTQLTRMRRWGVLGRWIPEFGRVIGQMQHDLFHVYTVDAHTMQVIRQLRRFRSEDLAETYPVATHCIRKIARKELLYIAALFHDIAKGRGGDHSTLGALDAAEFCDRHGLAPEERELIVWLVRDHLIMSYTAQNEDIDDPAVIAEFAARVGGQERLDHLYALTAADITATNPTLWNSWRAALLRRLYNATKRFYRSGAAPERSRVIAERREDVAARLEQRDVDPRFTARLLASLDDDYFLVTDPADAAWQLSEIAAWQGPLPLVRVRDQGAAPGRREGATEILVNCVDAPSVFAATVAVLDQLDLDVVGAYLHTTSEGYCVNAFHVLAPTGRALPSDPGTAQHVEAALREVLVPPIRVPAPARRRVPRSLRQFAVAAEVTHERNDRGMVQLHVVAADRPGLLAHIAALLRDCGLSVQAARIATLGERIQDVFVVSAAEPETELDDRRLAQATRWIEDRIDAHVDAQS